MTDITRKALRAQREREFRVTIDAEFKAGELGIENGWLFQWHAPCNYPCAGVEYGCPPSCYMEPIVDLWEVCAR